MSDKTLLLFPLVGMILLTMIVSVLLIKARYKAVLKDGIHPKYFKHNRGAKIPDYLIRVTQHYENLFETPIMFYTGIVLILSLALTDTVYITLSWLYLFTRIAHAYIHMSLNRLRARRNIFLASYAVLFMLWIKLALDIFSLK